MQLFALNQLTGFRGKKFDIFPTGSYVKTYTMSADGGHLEYQISTNKRRMCPWDTDAPAPNIEVQK